MYYSRSAYAYHIYLDRISKKRTAVIISTVLMVSSDGHSPIDQSKPTQNDVPKSSKTFWSFRRKRITGLLAKREPIRNLTNCVYLPNLLSTMSSKRAAGAGSCNHELANWIDRGQFYSDHFGLTTERYCNGTRDWCTMSHRQDAHPGYTAHQHVAYVSMGSSVVL